jgi:hypothetical protein
MTLLLWAFVGVEGKTRKSGEQGGGVVSDRGSLRRANEARNLTSTNSDTSTRTGKMTTQNKEAINNKRRHKDVTAKIWFCNLLKYMILEAGHSYPFI